ncbi:unnamed protein product [Sphacelaria rigidula]
MRRDSNLFSTKGIVTENLADRGGGSKRSTTSCAAYFLLRSDNCSYYAYAPNMQIPQGTMFQGSDESTIRPDCT